MPLDVVGAPTLALHAACLCLVLLAPMGAQTTQGAIRGRVYDRYTGYAVPSAAVTYHLAATNESGVSHADGEGFYSLVFLSPGMYRLRATAAAFQAQEIDELELAVAARVELDFPMRPLSDVWEKGIGKSVRLPGSGAILNFFGPDLETGYSAQMQSLSAHSGALQSTLSYVIDPQQVENLPISGRDMYTMLVSHPGVTADNATARGLGLTVNGQRASSSNFLLDGVENNDYLITGPLSVIAPEAVQEYRVTTSNFSAEYGRAAGFVANAVTQYVPRPRLRLPQQ